MVEIQVLMNTTVHEGLEHRTAFDAPSARRIQWIGLRVLTSANLVYAMDMTVLVLAVPAIGADLLPSSDQLLWIIDIYGFFVAGSLITMGILGDRIGGRDRLARRSGQLETATR